MRILLTGSTGFIGSAIHSHLTNEGHDVVGIHLRASHSQGESDTHHRLCDIGSYESVKALADAIEPCEAIVHASATRETGLFAKDVSIVNCLGVQNMLWLASRWKTASFVFLSSAPLIGTPKQFPITEEHPTSPHTAYHASKLFGEQLVRIADVQGIRGVSLRLTAPVGPGLPRGRLLSVLISNALAGDPIQLSGTGSRRQNYVDVRDIASAVSLSLDENVSGVFNIASSETISNLALAERCVNLCRSQSKITFNGLTDPEEGFNWDVSIEKAKREMRYSPRYSLDQSISAVIEDYEN